MGTVLGIIIGLVFAAGLLIGLISKDSGRGYRPDKPLDGPPSHKPLDGPPPNARSSVQHVVWEQKNGVHLEIGQNYFYYDDTPIGIITDDDPYFWNVRIFKNLKETCFNPRTGRLEILTIRRNREDKQ